MNIRPYQASDWVTLWPILEPVFRAGETYPCPPDISEREAQKYWIQTPAQTFVARAENGAMLASYYIKPNQPGLGSHVCNCGYIVAETARGQGLATSLCEHSQQQAIKMGFRAMQYNLVVETNDSAVYLWKKLGFDVIGVLPGAFNSATAGYVDALIMYKTLVK